MSLLKNLKKGVAEFTDLIGSLAADRLTPNLQVASANGAITIPDGGRKQVIITKGTAAAMTLGTPTTAQNGVVIEIVSQTAAAHTVAAATIGFNEGNAGADTATFGGAIGDGFTVMAYGGEWYILNTINISLG